jgi:hypothetical protein
MNIGVVLAGDIERTIYESDGIPTRGITVTLIRSNGEELAAARSEIDGYFSLTGTLGGEY